MSEKDNFKTYYALSLAWQLGFLIAAPVAGFLFLGFLADKFLGTHPFLLITGMIVGIIITIYEVYHLFIPLIENEQKNDA